MKDWYTYAMLGLMGWVGWLHLTGRCHNDGDAVRNVPATVRSNPGSYRSHYTSHYVHIGGK
jgi:hypothetical protein